ncbi:FAD/FMN-containing dehydrogenase, partial [Elysia marginata]
GQLLQPFDAGYAAVVNLNNARHTRHPYIIVMAETVADVQKAMKFARKHQLMLFSQISVGGASP